MSNQKFKEVFDEITVAVDELIECKHVAIRRALRDGDWTEEEKAILGRAEGCLSRALSHAEDALNELDPDDEWRTQ